MRQVEVEFCPVFHSVSPSGILIGDNDRPGSSPNFNGNHALTSHVMDASCPSDVSSNDVVWWRGGNEETLDLFNWRLPG